MNFLQRTSGLFVPKRIPGRTISFTVRKYRIDLPSIMLPPWMRQRKPTLTIVGDERVSGELVKTNKKTVWVRLKDDRVIKRHITKHAVSFLDVR